MSRDPLLSLRPLLRLAAMPDDSSPSSESTVNDPQRLQAVEDTGLVDTAPEVSFDRFTQMAVDLLDVRAAVISLVGPEEQFIKSSAGLEQLGVEREEQRLPLSHSFAQLVVASGKPVVVQNAEEDDRLENTLDVAELGILAYAAFPLVTTTDGHTLGAFCALNDAPHDWTKKELAVIEGLSNAITAHIELQEAKNEAQRAQRSAETARNEAERAQEEAEAANAAKTRFVANMSHELRTPLNSVIGYSDMFMQDPHAWGEERLQDGLRRIHASGEELLGLINDVLNLSKAEAGRLRISPETFALAPLVEHLAQEIRPRMSENGNDLVVNGLDDLDDTDVYTDESKVRQILSNLLSNAAKYTQEGTISLKVAVRPSEGRGDEPSGDDAGTGATSSESRREIVFVVEDTGLGMTEAEQEKIFEAFERTEEVENTGGTGLGLSIVQNLCDMLGGEVQVESRKGEGSRFTVRLPAEASGGGSQNETDDSPLADADRPPPTADALPPQEEKLVLIIDDDRNTRILLRNHLQESGFEIETATNGTEGIEQVRDLHPMAIMLDVLMEEMDGWEVLTRLKDDPSLRHIPVIMISVTPDEGRGLQLGATDHLVKPVDRERLAELLQQHRRDFRQAGDEEDGAQGDAPSAFSVLVIENDEATRDVVRQVVEEQGGHKMHEAANGRTALDLLEEGLAPNLILLDLMMPEMDGFDFLRSAREYVRDVPVVVLTAKDLTDEDLQRLNGQVERIIRKEGFAYEDLLSEVEERVQTLHRRRTSSGSS